MLAVGVWLAVREHLWLRNARIASGTVIELIAVRGSKGGPTYKPRVRFTANDGGQHEFVSRFSSRPSAFKEGESVTVAYEARSYKGRILTFGQRFGLAASLVVAGSACIALATLFLVGRQVVPRIYLH